MKNSKTMKTSLFFIKGTSYLDILFYYIHPDGIASFVIRHQINNLFLLLK